MSLPWHWRGFKVPLSQTILGLFDFLTSGLRNVFISVVLSCLTHRKESSCTHKELGVSLCPCQAGPCARSRLVPGCAGSVPVPGIQPVCHSYPWNSAPVQGTGWNYLFGCNSHLMPISGTGWCPALQVPGAGTVFVLHLRGADSPKK